MVHTFGNDLRSHPHSLDGQRKHQPRRLWVQWATSMLQEGLPKCKHSSRWFSLCADVSKTRLVRPSLVISGQLLTQSTTALSSQKSTFIPIHPPFQRFFTMSSASVTCGRDLSCKGEHANEQTQAAPRKARACLNQGKDLLSYMLGVWRVRSTGAAAWNHGDATSTSTSSGLRTS